MYMDYYDYFQKTIEIDAFTSHNLPATSACRHNMNVNVFLQICTANLQSLDRWVAHSQSRKHLKVKATTCKNANLKWEQEIRENILNKWGSFKLKWF